MDMIPIQFNYCRSPTESPTDCQRNKETGISAADNTAWTGRQRRHGVHSTVSKLKRCISGRAQCPGMPPEMRRLESRSRVAALAGIVSMIPPSFSFSGRAADLTPQDRLLAFQH